jgi:hypothetical protein
LRVSSQGIDTQHLSYSGKIDPQTGFFTQSNTSQTLKLGGAMSMNGREAGYFFLAPVGNGSIRGATLWGR